MKFPLSFRLGRLLAFSALFAPAAAFAQSDTVTISLTAGSLYNSTGTLLPTGNLVLLIADTGNNGFGSFSPGSALSAGSFLNLDDQIIGVTSITNDGTGTAMQLFPSITVGTGSYSNLAVGDPLAVVWFSTLTSSSTVLTSGTYGLFSGTSADSDQGDSWVIPPTTSTIDLNFQTLNDFGSHPESDGYANLTAVPEPSTWGLIAGVMALAYAAARVRPPSRAGGPR